MNVPITGFGINVIILSESGLHQEWMSFATWYSIRTFLPDASYSIAVKDKLDFPWTTKAGIKKHRHLDISSYPIPFLAVKSGAMAIRPFRESQNGWSHDKTCLLAMTAITDDINHSLCSDCKSEEDSFLTTIQTTCGDFNKNIWTKKAIMAPFYFAKKLKINLMTSKENRVLDLWSKMGPAFAAINKNRR